jgi:hypothetical protein
MAEAVLVPNEAKRNFFWSFTLLTILLQALAIVALARRAVELGSLSAPLELVMAAYKATMQLLFGWAEPYLRTALASINSYLNWHVTLYPYWKDYFVLFALYSVAYNRVITIDSLERGFAKSKCLAMFALRQWRDLTIVFAGSVAAGVLTLDSDVAGLVIFAVGAFLLAPFFGLLLPLSGKSRNNSFFRDNSPDRRWYVQLNFMRFAGSIYILVFFLAGAFLLYTGHNNLDHISINKNALPFLLVTGTWVAVGFVLLGSSYLSRMGLREKTPEGQRQQRKEARLGLAILGGFVGAVCFFALDAGLKLMAA